MLKSNANNSTSSPTRESGRFLICSWPMDPCDADWVSPMRLVPRSFPSTSTSFNLMTGLPSVLPDLFSDCLKCCQNPLSPPLYSLRAAMPQDGENGRWGNVFQFGFTFFNRASALHPGYANPLRMGLGNKKSEASRNRDAAPGHSLSLTEIGCDYLK